MNARKISREHNFDALIAVEVARICAAAKSPHIALSRTGSKPQKIQASMKNQE
jgi:hypothetical protein